MFLGDIEFTSCDCSGCALGLKTQNCAPLLASCLAQRAENANLLELRCLTVVLSVQTDRLSCARGTKSCIDYDQVAVGSFGRGNNSDLITNRLKEILPLQVVATVKIGRLEMFGRSVGIADTGKFSFIDSQTPSTAIGCQSKNGFPFYLGGVTSEVVAHGSIEQFHLHEQ